MNASQSATALADSRIANDLTLVTGASGFLGHAVMKLLRTKRATRDWVGLSAFGDHACA